MCIPMWIFKKYLLFFIVYMICKTIFDFCFMKNDKMQLIRVPIFYESQYFFSESKFRVHVHR